MNLPHVSISWVDVLTALLLLIGVLRGRKRGLSEELLDMMQWVVIVVAAGMLYKALGDLLNRKPMFSQITYYVMSYTLIALVLKGIFSMIKRYFGQKLIDSDAFGRFEFYLGMVAGSIRWACMYIFFLSLLHAPAYSQEYRSEKAKQDAYNYGDISFPTLMSIQDAVYKSSLTGKYSEQYLAMVLLQPASGSTKTLRGDNSIGKRREHEIDALMR